MRALSRSAVLLVFGVSSLSMATACAVTCIEDAGGKTCTAKSLKRFDGAPSPLQTFDRAPGAPVTIDVVYGNVLVQRSSSNKIEVQFSPYDYAGYDDQAGASREMAQNLKTGVATAGGIVVSVQRAGGSTGLGADALVRLPADFDGALKVVNHGDGPLNDFDVRIEHVGRASALSVTNDSLLGDCSIQGAPTVRSTTVRCGERISVLDVSDSVNIVDTDDMYDAAAPAITVRFAAIAPTSPGSAITTASGAIAVVLPRGGGYVVDARSPVRGTVREGGLPPGCSVRGRPNAKTLICGRGPTLAVTAGAHPEFAGQPWDSNVSLSYR